MATAEAREFVPARRNDPGCGSAVIRGAAAGSGERESCLQHTMERLIKLKKHKRCSYPGCDQKPSYGAAAGSRNPQFCSKHA